MSGDTDSTWYGGAGTGIYSNPGLALDYTGKIGIGTTAPTSLLHVTGAVTGKALAIFNETGDQNILEASASGTTRMSLDRTGRMTLTSTGSPIVAYGPGSNLNGIYFINSSNNATIMMGTDNGNKMMVTGLGNNDVYFAVSIVGYGNGPYIHLVNGGGINLRTEQATADIAFYPGAASTPSIFFKDDGKVGIGTTAPIGKLNLAGEYTIAGNGLVFGADGDTALWEYGDDNLALTIGGNDKLYISTSKIMSVNSTGMQIVFDVPTSTSPVFVPARSDYDTGIGWAGNGILSLI